ncbi:MAG: putative methylthioribose-1-phosphate isomerase [Methanoregulaceae archaeon PtaB.Bin009]|jgi:methylthioribose-1-phosphate isomerase|nr:MAG: putative methylthioribose-1-phosphate isomerase [Methanoregulaceae archaeon PtaB.Bin009]OPY40515.1 MAG: putative methylthioribose-1-phosphate isomerase [Methanoregulaceae archaeon PtaU1.Bin066]HNQ28745.1 S-methyl-5-thioribose-1-phosphate isomerase [Methanolinea sp.]
MRAVETLHWDDEEVALTLIDQTRLPGHFRIVRCRTVDRLITAIRRLEIRGAPALGVAGAYGVVLASRKIREREHFRFMEMLKAEAARITDARPTAVNLSLGVEIVMRVVESAHSVTEAREKALRAAREFTAADSRACHELGDYGAALIGKRCTVLTHCNAGALACSEWGTALGVVRSAVEAGSDVEVIACETRPLLQGARLTAWELQRDGIPVTVIPDSSAAFLMKLGEIDAVILGADRITPDGVFNKIGTYMHAVCASHHGVPFYVAAPLSTFDPHRIAREVTIEQRDRNEVAFCGSTVTVPDGVGVKNYAFDLTPHQLVTAFITDIGVISPPVDWNEIEAARKDRGL